MWATHIYVPSFLRAWKLARSETTSNLSRDQLQAQKYERHLHLQSEGWPHLSVSPLPKLKESWGGASSSLTCP